MCIRDREESVPYTKNGALKALTSSSPAMGPNASPMTRSVCLLYTSVASIKSVTITDESSEENKNNPFVTEKKDIYKYELVNMLNSSGQTMISYGYTLEQAVDYLCLLYTSKICFR